MEKCLDNNVILVLKKVFIGFMLFFLFWGETWHSFVRFSQIEYHADSYFNIWCVTSISTSPANQFIGWVMYIFKFISSVWATLDSPFGTAVKCYFCISLSHILTQFLPHLDSHIMFHLSPLQFTPWCPETWKVESATQGKIYWNSEMGMR